MYDLCEVVCNMYDEILSHKLKNCNRFWGSILCLTYYGIPGVFHNNFLEFSDFGLFRKLMRMKAEQGTEKASEHKSCT